MSEHTRVAGMDAHAETDAYSPTVPYAEVKARLLADPATRAAYDALEPAYQIARLRIEAGLTQAQLAELVGTKQPSIARLERGKQQPTVEFLQKLAAALGKRLEINFVPAEQPTSMAERIGKSAAMSATGSTAP